MTGNLRTSGTTVIFSDFPDPDVIRDGDVWYMASTTMYYMPGCALLRSYNLLDWEPVSYVYDTLDDTPGQKLEDGKGIYGQGMWAPCLRKHDGMFYVSFVCNDTHRTYLYRSNEITGPWTKCTVSGFYHDMSLLFDDDGRTYAVHGNRNIWLTELAGDLSGPKDGGINRIIVKDSDDVMLGYEGSHIYKINGRYYIFLIHWPRDGVRTEACFTSDRINGPYEGKDVLSTGYRGWNAGVAQGGITDDGEGNWYAVLFQDHGALGRMPVLVPVRWEDNFPVFGTGGKVPEKMTVRDFSPDHAYDPLWTSRFLNEKTGRLNLQWQFNHNPDPSLYQFDVKDGIQTYTVTTGTTCRNLCLSRNLLTQRAFTENCAVTVRVNAACLNDGDYAGLSAFEGEYSFAAVTRRNGNFRVTTGGRKLPGTFKIGDTDTETPAFHTEEMIDSPQVFLKLELRLSEDEQSAVYSYSTDGKDYIHLGDSKVRFTLDHFTGCRFGLFNYSTVLTGGKASFSHFDYRII